MGARLRHRDCIPIGRIRSSRRADASRISAYVDGREIWFETAQLDLTPVAEAFGSAFLIPALYRHAVLEFDDPVDPTWLDHLPSIHSLLEQWWQLPALMPRARPRSPATVPAGGEHALFFSGGADCLFSLLRSGAPINRLVLVAGFDYGLEDVERHAEAERTLREVADARGLTWAVVRTNAREHPLFDDVSWENAHGGVLAAVGHALGNSVASALISSSVPQATPVPWGSHWLLDPLWSSSRRTFTHFGQDYSKQDKLRAIAAEPLAQRHLRVCWENRSNSGNCSICYKCLYARLVLAEIGALDQFETLEGISTLAAGFDRLPCAKGEMVLFRRLMDSPRLPADVKRSLHDLVERTARPQRSRARFLRAMVGRVLARRKRRTHPFTRP